MLFHGTGNRRSFDLHLKITALLVAAVSLLPITPAGAAFPGTNGKLAFARLVGATYEIYVMNANGSGQTRLTTNAANDYDPAWSPDGTRIAFTSERDGNPEIYVMNADGSGQTRLTTNTRNDFNPAWRPDGNQIAFVTQPGFDFEIYLMTAAGAGQTNISSNAANDLSPAWSPDGSRIGFVSARSGSEQIYTMNANGSNQIRRTVNVPGFDVEPAWSPDGGRIAFSRLGAQFTYDIYAMAADGTGQINLTNNAANDTHPAWSPDGAQIAFTRGGDGTGEIYVMNANGTGQMQLTNNAVDDREPDWQPIPVAGNIAITVSGFEGTSRVNNCDLGECFATPYTMGAVGTTQFMESTLGSISVYDKTSGTLLAPRQPMSAFWNSVGGPPGAANGNQRVMFDHYSSRWLTTAMGVTPSDVYIAVSDTPNALGSWKFTRIIGAANTVADFPTLGLDDQGVYISTNNYDSVTSDFLGTSLFAIPKADLFGGAPTTANLTRFDTAPAAPDIGLSIQGAVNWGGNPTATPSMLVASLQADESLYFYQLNGVNAAGATRTPSVLIPGSPELLPGPARQPDGTRLVDTLDARIGNPVYQANGKLYAVRTVQPTGSNYTVVRWSVHNASTGALIEEGDIAGDVGFDYYQGSIAANQFGEAVIGYNRSGGADKGLAGRISFMARAFRTDPAGGLDQFGPEILLRVSAVSDYRCGSRLFIATCLQRWGPTSAVTVDPLSPHRFFAIGQYAANWAVIPAISATEERAVWHTYIGRITFAPDTDGDGFADTTDNCTLVANADQRDTNGDGFGNLCDPDFNNNGIVDSQDGALLKSAFGSGAFPDRDLNGNGIVDSSDGARLKARFGQPPGPSGLVP